MALKEMISSWNDGVKSFEAGDYSTALEHFTSIPEPSSKIYFNLSCTWVKLGRIHESIKNLTESVNKDPYFPLGYYQRGLHYLKLKQYDKAVADFEKSYEKMHSREVIDYSQLGMTYKLYAVEVWLSKAAVFERKGQQHTALQVIVEASKAIDADEAKIKCVEAIHLVQGGGHLEPAVIPDTCLFHPSKEHLANLEKREYVAKAKIVSEYKPDEDEDNNFSTIRRSPSPARKKSDPQVSQTKTLNSGSTLQVPGDYSRKTSSMPVDFTRSPSPRPRLSSGPPTRPPPSPPSNVGHVHRPPPSPPSHNRDQHRPPPLPPPHSRDQHRPPPSPPPHSRDQHRPPPSPPPHSRDQHRPPPSPPLHSRDQHRPPPSPSPHSRDQHRPPPSPPPHSRDQQRSPPSPSEGKGPRKPPPSPSEGRRHHKPPPSPLEGRQKRKPTPSSSESRDQHRSPPPPLESRGQREPPQSPSEVKGHNSHRPNVDPSKTNDIHKSQRPPLPNPKDDNKYLENEKPHMAKKPPAQLPQNPSNGPNRPQPPLPKTDDVDSFQSELSMILYGQLKKINTGHGADSTRPSATDKSSSAAKKPPRPPLPSFVNDEEPPPPLPKKDYPHTLKNL